MAIFDTPEACVERLRSTCEEFNIGRVICWFNIGGMIPHVQVMRSMELFAAEVMPHLRRELDRPGAAAAAASVA